MIQKSLQMVFRKLTTPAKIQDYVNNLTMRKPSGARVVQSPIAVHASQGATCMEGALFAVAALDWHKKESWLLDLKVASDNTRDVDHVVAVFMEHGHYGAISKTKHNVLRFREPVYKTVRELAMSYFHEYFLDDGTKTLRSYSKLFPVIQRHGEQWIESQEDLYEIACDLDTFKHFPVLPDGAIRTLRKADDIEIRAGKLKE